MIPQLGAPLGLDRRERAVRLSSSATSRRRISSSWGWRYPFFVAFAINVVALFARLRIVVTPEYQQLFESRELQPAPVVRDAARPRAATS